MRGTLNFKNFFIRYSLSLIQKIIEKTLNTNEYGRIFMFHEVSNLSMEGSDKNVSLTEKSFKKFIDFFNENGYEFLSLEDLHFIDRLNPKVIFITFDDIFQSAYSNAIPYLREKQIPYTVFLTTNFIFENKYYNFEILKNLQEDHLCSIGSHSVNHNMMRFLSYEKVENEVNYSKNILEKWTDRNIQYFAFPFGSLYACSISNIKSLQKSSFSLGFSTINIPLNRISIKLKYFLPRINVNEKKIMELINERCKD